MFHILGFLFIIIIAILIIGLTIVGSVLRAIFGLGGRRSTTHTYTNGPTYRKQYHASDVDMDEEEIISEKETSRHKKIFSDDEGEYVDFEEIKKND